jgi:hypothetical protein
LLIDTLISHTHAEKTDKQKRFAFFKFLAKLKIELVLGGVGCPQEKKQSLRSDTCAEIASRRQRIQTNQR